MAVTETKDKSKEPEAKSRKETFDPTIHEGFHVMRDDGMYLGTHATEEDAQYFIDGHLAPQKIKASIVEGKGETAEAEEAADVE